MNQLHLLSVTYSNSLFHWEKIRAVFWNVGEEACRDLLHIDLDVQNKKKKTKQNIETNLKC